ncbi:MAG TPA: hypothetical protein VGO61_21910 [Steroidobacteraceae bacterium]|jgi:hypothetical protein|nr:hypothetical protein [Steroidobacteraceae bacterium]
MNTKLLVSVCAAAALMAACNKPHDKDATATPDTQAPPPADTQTPPPPADAQTPPPADAQPPASDEKPANPPPQ